MSSERDLSNWELVALACYLEGGATRAVDTEEIAVRASALAPRRFSWKKFPERIDLDAVRVSLTDAAKSKYGSLVTGSKERGWSLSATGLEFATGIAASRPELTGDAAPELAGERRQFAAAVARESTGLRESAAFAKWSGGRAADITVYEFFTATRTAEYLPPKEMIRRQKHLEALLAADEVLAPFVHFLFDTFAEKYHAGTE